MKADEATHRHVQGAQRGTRVKNILERPADWQQNT